MLSSVLALAAGMEHRIKRLPSEEQQSFAVGNCCVLYNNKK
jgi:hypothetical protein